MIGKEMTREINSLTTAENLAKAVSKAKKRGLPPVHKWNPPFQGKIDMRITRQGTWLYNGTPINRPAMVKLFSTILRRDGDRYYLVTPVEKVEIDVDDAPFAAIDFEAAGEGRDQIVMFETNVGDKVMAGSGHPIRLRIGENDKAAIPYILIRDNLEAIVDRKSYFRLIDICMVHGDWFGLWSDGMFFRFARSDETGEWQPFDFKC